MSVQLQACQAEKAKLRAENALKLACVIDERDALQTKLEGLTVDEDWTKDDHVAMVNDANAVLQASLVEAEADAEALRALAAWATAVSTCTRRAVICEGYNRDRPIYRVELYSAGAASVNAEHSDLAAAIMDALGKDAQ